MEHVDKKFFEPNVDLAPLVYHKRYSTNLRQIKKLQQFHINQINTGLIEKETKKNLKTIGLANLKIYLKVLNF